MAGHSKRHNIKHRKAAQDAKKGKYYARVAKIIQLAAKDGNDASMNPKLALALQKAKQYNLPKDIIDRAVIKGSGTDGEQLFEITYEAYGPGGVAMMIKCITTNTTRSGQNVRALVTKYGGNMGEPGSVGWQFTEKGQLYIEGKRVELIKNGKKTEDILPLDQDELEMDVLETDAESVEFDEGIATIRTSRESFISIKEQLESQWYALQEANLELLASNFITLDDTTTEKLARLIEMIEEDDDVDEVFHNAS
jgi:YebC/PmpR family DNA-binding regulatory protein